MMNDTPKQLPLFPEHEDTDIWWFDQAQFLTECVMNTVERRPAMDYKQLRRFKMPCQSHDWVDAMTTYTTMVSTETHPKSYVPRYWFINTRTSAYTTHSMSIGVERDNGNCLRVMEKYNQHGGVRWPALQPKPKKTLDEYRRPGIMLSFYATSEDPCHGYLCFVPRLYEQKKGYQVDWIPDHDFNKLVELTVKSSYMDLGFYPDWEMIHKRDHIQQTLCFDIEGMGFAFRAAYNAGIRLQRRPGIYFEECMDQEND